MSTVQALDAGQRTVLELFARRAREQLGDEIARIVLFGSRARGDADDSSDIDVLVVVRSPPDNVHRLPPARATRHRD